MSTKVVQVGDMEGEEMKILAKRNGEADMAWDSLLSAFGRGETHSRARNFSVWSIMCVSGKPQRILQLFAC